MECCLIGKHELGAGFGQRLLRVLGEREAGLPQLLQSMRAQPRQVDEAGQGEQRLVRGDVGGRLLPANVLLPGLQGEDIAALARGVYRLADDPARHTADQVRAGGQEAVVRPAVGLVVARRLALADGDRAAVVARRLEHAERDRVDVRDRERSRVRRGGGEVRGRLEATEEVRLLEDRARRVLGGVAELGRVGHAVTVRHLDDLEPEARSVGLDHLAHLRVDGFRDDDAGTARCMLRDVAGVGGDRGAVVSGGVGDVEAGQLADRSLVLEDRLQDALAHLGLVRRVRRQQLPAREHGVDDGRDVVVVDARAEKRELDTGVDVLRGQVAQVGDQLLLRERGRDVEGAVEAHACGDVAEELVDRRHADRLEHLPPVRLCEREVAH